MHLAGTRRGSLIVALLVLLVAVGVWQVARLYVRQVTRNLGPEVLRNAQARLGRGMAEDRIDYSRPGCLLIEGLRVARGKSFRDGTLLTARRVELRYDPSLLKWTSLVAAAAGFDTHATLTAERVVIRQPAPLPPDVLATTETASAELDLRPFLAGRSDPLAAVSRLDLGRPFARV